MGRPFNRGAPAHVSPKQSNVHFERTFRLTQLLRDRDEGKPKNITELVSYPFFFSSTSNKEKFLANPWKYAPAYGGFCAFGIAYERKRGQSGQPWAPDW